MTITRGVINGQEYMLTINQQYIIYGTNASISVEQSTKDITCRETNNWTKSILKDRQWGMEFEGKLAYYYPGGHLNPPAGSSNYPNGLQAISLRQILHEAFIAGQEVLLMLYPQNCPQSGNTPFWDPFYFGWGYLVSASVDTPNEDSSTVNLSFAGRNELKFVGIGLP
jgi:hypothetical protein